MAGFLPDDFGWGDVGAEEGAGFGAPVGEVRIDGEGEHRTRVSELLEELEAFELGCFAVEGVGG